MNKIHLYKTKKRRSKKQYKKQLNNLNRIENKKQNYSKMLYNQYNKNYQKKQIRIIESLNE